MPEKPLSPKCVDPKVFLDTTVCSWDGGLASREDGQADQDSRPVDDGSGLPPRLRKLSLSSQSSLSESGGGDAGHPSEKRLSVGKRVKQKMIVDGAELTSGSPDSSGDGKIYPRGGEENCPSVDGENGDGDDPMVAVDGKNGDVDDPMVAVEGENGAGDDPMVTVEPVVAVKPRQSSSNLKDVDEAPSGDASSDSMSVDEDHPADEPVVAVKPRQLSSNLTDVDEAPSGDASSDSMSVDEDHPADGADPKKSFRVIDGDNLINVDNSKSNEKSLESVPSAQPEPPLERRQSSRIAMAKIDYHVQVSKTSGARRRRASKKDKDLPDVVLLIITLSKGLLNVI